MIKRFVILRRKPEMSTREFWNYWENIHGSLIAKIPRLVKYIQYHVESERLDEIDDPIDLDVSTFFRTRDHAAF